MFLTFCGKGCDKVRLGTVFWVATMLRRIFSEDPYLGGVFRIPYAGKDGHDELFYLCQQ